MTNEFHAIAEDELQCQGCGHKTHKQTDYLPPTQVFLRNRRKGNLPMFKSGSKSHGHQNKK